MAKTAEGLTPLPPTPKEQRMIARLRYNQFAKYCYWLLQEFDKGHNLFYAKDLAEVEGITIQTGYRFFKDITVLGYVIENKAGNTVSYSLKLNSDKPLLFGLLPYIKKTLEIK